MLAFSFILLCLIILPAVYRMWVPPLPLKYELTTLERTWISETREQNRSKNDYPLFAFDPNTLSEDSLRLIGFSEKQAAILVKRRDRGNIIRSAEEWLDYPYLSIRKKEELLPYLNLSLPTATVISPTQKRNSQSGIVRLQEINSMDSTAWDKLPGIGPKLSHRIISYREKLGGFFSTNQLKEVWGLPDSTYQLIRSRLYADSTLIRKTDLQTVTEEKLAKHPYIGYKRARLLLRFRVQRGILTEKTIREEIPDMPDSVLQRLFHYFQIAE